jgi:tRNA-specific 2-thiouridylase
VDSDGRRLGEHAGVHRFTVGQRKGLGLTSRRPLYVLRVEPETRTVVVGEEAELEAPGLLAKDANWVSIPPPGAPVAATAKIRYRAEDAGCTVTPLGGDRVRVDFRAPQRAVTPGQAVVFYDGDICLGGAWIEGPTA